MSEPPRIALYPGTFDPMTNGHLDVIKRAKRLFDSVIVAVSVNPDKKQLFSREERFDMISELMQAECPCVEVATYTGLTVDFAREVGATVIVRGLRNVTDLNYEFQLALTNRAVADIETAFIMTGERYGFTSSTLIKQIAAGGEVERLHRLLPPLILEKMKQKKLELGEKMDKLRTDGLPND